MQHAILIVEDEEKISRLLEIELEMEGYRVGRVNNGADGLSTYQQGGWDLVLLDVMLPGMSGIEVLRRIRARDQATPVLLLTAKHAVEDKVSGLDLGANDYITKPFQIEELLARIRAALRLSQPLQNEGGEELEAAGQTWRFADLQLNEVTREVSRGQRQIELTPREFDLLLYMLRHPRQVLSRDQILEAIWGFDYSGETNIVDVYIRYLRKKIDQSDDAELLQTVRGVGYVLREGK